MNYLVQIGWVGIPSAGMMIASLHTWIGARACGCIRLLQSVVPNTMRKFLLRWYYILPVLMWRTNIMGIYVTHFCYSCLMSICFSGGIMISVTDARGHLCQREVVHRLRHPRLQLQRGWKLDSCTILVSIMNWIIHIDDPLFEFLMKKSFLLNYLVQIGWAGMPTARMMIASPHTWIGARACGCIRLLQSVVPKTMRKFLLHYYYISYLF